MAEIEYRIFQETREAVARETTRLQRIAAGHRPAGRPHGPGRARGRPELLPPRGRRRGRHPDHGRPAPRHRGRQRRAVHPERHLPRPRRRADPDHHRAEHGRKIDLPPPGRPHRRHGPDGIVRARRIGLAGPRRPHLHPDRGDGLPERRAVDVHGRDAGDGRHPEQRDAEEPHPPRRGRPGDQHVRRPEHRLGRGRAPAREGRGPGQDPVRHPLP